MSSIFDLFRQIEKKGPESRPVDFIVAGLGNPGEKYLHSRHNAGFMCVDYIAGKLGIRVNRVKFRAICGDIELSGRRGIIMKPQTFMNNSGEAVIAAAEFYKITPENIIVIQDDVALDYGRIRIRRKGSDGGHNGIKSIISHLDSDEFPRIKIGAGIPPEGEFIDWVLGEIPKSEQPRVYECIENSLPALELIVAGKTDEAMNRYNR